MSKYEGEMIMKVNPYVDEEYRTEIKRLEKENAELKEVHESDKRSLALIAEKGAELEREISNLLSCKNCPDNKGGYICHKEYEDKCLAQKIQYIKELKEENTELKSDFIKSCKVKEQGFKEAEQALERKDKQLTKAKEIIKTFLGFAETFGYSPSFAPSNVLWKNAIEEDFAFMNMNILLHLPILYQNLCRSRTIY